MNHKILFFPLQLLLFPTVLTPHWLFLVSLVDNSCTNIKLMDNKIIQTDLTFVYPVFTGGKISSIIDQVEQSILIS